MKINKIVKLFKNTDGSSIFEKSWRALYHLVKSVYPKTSVYYPNRADNIYINTKILYEVKDEDK